MNKPLVFLAVNLALLLVPRTTEGTGKSQAPAVENEGVNRRLRYTASWAVEIAEGGDKMADVIARRYGFRNLGKVRIRDGVFDISSTTRGGALCFSGALFKANIFMKHCTPGINYYSKHVPYAALSEGIDNVKVVYGVRIVV